MIHQTFLRIFLATTFLVGTLVLSMLLSAALGGLVPESGSAALLAPGFLATGWRAVAITSVTPAADQSFLEACSAPKRPKTVNCFLPHQSPSNFWTNAGIQLSY
jgi:hypothetical protein